MPDQASSSVPSGGRMNNMSEGVVTVISQAMLDAAIGAYAEQVELVRTGQVIRPAPSDHEIALGHALHGALGAMSVADARFNASAVAGHPVLVVPDDDEALIDLIGSAIAGTEGYTPEQWASFREGNPNWLRSRPAYKWAEAVASALREAATK